MTSGATRTLAAPGADGTARPARVAAMSRSPSRGPARDLSGGGQRDDAELGLCPREGGLGEPNLIPRGLGEEGVQTGSETR